LTRCNELISFVRVEGRLTDAASTVLSRDREGADVGEFEQALQFP